jgi:hypothetical protein
MHGLDRHLCRRRFHSRLGLVSALCPRAYQARGATARPDEPGASNEWCQGHSSDSSIGPGLHIRTIAALMSVLDYGMTPLQAVNEPSLGMFPFTGSSAANGVLTVGAKFPGRISAGTSRSRSAGAGERHCGATGSASRSLPVQASFTVLLSASSRSGGAESAVDRLALAPRRQDKR